VEKGPAADAADAPQPSGFVQLGDEDEGDDDDDYYYYFFFVIFEVVEHRWNEIDRDKPKYSGGGGAYPSDNLSPKKPKRT
jgi:hypothetical protein